MQNTCIPPVSLPQHRRCLRSTRGVCLRPVTALGSDANKYFLPHQRGWQEESKGGDGNGRWRWQRGCIGGWDGEKVKQTKSLKEWCMSVQAATSMVDRPPTPGRLVNSGTKIAAERVSSRASRRAPEMACACMCTWWRVRTQGQEATRWVVPWDCIRTCVLDFFFHPLILSSPSFQLFFQSNCTSLSISLFS